MSKQLEDILTVDQFDRAGLETCTALANDRCIICHSPYTNAVRTLACNHSFDRECLISWLKSTSKPTTCPTCRQILIHRDRLPSIISGIMAQPNYTWNHFGLSHISDVELPTSNNLLTAQDLWQVISSARLDVTTTIHAATITRALILCGNVALEAAKLRETPFEFEQQLNLQKIIQAADVWVRRRDGQRVDVRRLPMLMITGTIDVLEEEEEENDVREIFGEQTERENRPDRYLTEMAFMAAWMTWQNSSEEPS